MTDPRIGRKTSPGFSDPSDPVRLDDRTGEEAASPMQPVRAVADVAEAPKPRSARGRPLIEVEVVRERGRMPRPDPSQSCYEIWTQNTVYLVDARMRCVQVRDLASGEPKPDHPFLGGRLVGGQAQEPALEMSHPLPRPGACAVFDLRKNNRRQFTRTSAVERVVLRVRIVTITDGASVPSWEELSEDDD